MSSNLHPQWTEDNEKEHLHGHLALNNGRLHRQQLQYSSIFFIVHLYEKVNERHWIQSTNTHGFKQFLSYILQETKLSTATVHVAKSGVPIDLILIKSLQLQYRRGRGLTTNRLIIYINNLIIFLLFRFTLIINEDKSSGDTTLTYKRGGGHFFVTYM